MKTEFSIHEAAQMADMTSETLRHYDRIGLVKPCRRDEWTGYRYYSQQEIVRLHTIQALRRMDLSLSKIREVLELNNLEQVVAFLKQAENQADEKMAQLQYAKAKIRLARMDYEKKLGGHEELRSVFVRKLPARVILLSDTLQTPSLDTLWNYHAHFYKQVGEERREWFAFEDLAGMYTKEGRSRLFAVCIRYPDEEGLTILPAGKYVCANCTEEERETVLQELNTTAAREYGIEADAVVKIVVVSGILQWSYQLQVLVEPDPFARRTLIRE